MLKKLLAIIAALAGATAIGFVVGYLAMLVLPCSWFGNNFEGACGYGALWASISLGVLAAAVAFVAMVFKVANASERSGNGASSKALWGVWAVLLLAQYLAIWVWGDIHLRSIIQLPISLLSLGAFVAVSAVLLKRAGRPPATAGLAIIPWFGPLVVAALLAKHACAAMGSVDVRAAR